MIKEAIVHIAATTFVLATICCILAGFYWTYLLREPTEPLFPREYSAADEASLVVEQYLKEIGATL